MTEYQQCAREIIADAKKQKARLMRAIEWKREADDMAVWLAWCNMPLSDDLGNADWISAANEHNAAALDYRQKHPDWRTRPLTP